VNEAKLDKAFSTFIRYRDTNAEGYGACWTCGKIIHFKDGHCGHFISRRHKATRWNEQNCGLQLLALSRGTCKYGKFEYEQLSKYYRDKAAELKKLKS